MNRLLFKQLKIFFIPIYRKENTSLCYLQRINSPWEKKKKMEIKLQIHRVLQSWGDLSA